MMRLNNIKKVYGNGSLQVPVLHGINLTITDGEFVAIMGPSGSGKSTLMNIIGFLDTPTEGTVILNEEEVRLVGESRLAKLRNEHIGFVFQQFFLLPKLSALKNVEVPLLYAGVPKKERMERSKEMLTKVGLANRFDYLPNQLSGGQKQRVAIARALVNNPTIILADEPTGALDTKTSAQIMELFVQLNQEGKTVIIITHEKEIAMYSNRILTLRDGLIIEDRRNEKHESLG
ncbi:ABC transporter ATP-binding protein [Bacillus aquiflavi]|uniref:ABC transporter ATP-binding protein n=1 Tax=Bacillus aquiflavi TaxID=2672567 RepID=A0A6B3W2S6_9BACI|nr:ABC transporter ATP-binding protein [Bacillus aquiflavi]MBA4538685.1 ABC transporter ATP-binding protein [Bacillus aquiflavi]NEY83045.1 ABC transporter ATP-binding protein [Bacillus aquiflavi]